VDGPPDPHTSIPPEQDDVGKIGLQHSPNNHYVDFQPGQPTLDGSDHPPSYVTGNHQAIAPVQGSPIVVPASYNSFAATMPGRVPTEYHSANLQYNTGAQSWGPVVSQENPYLHGVPVTSSYAGYDHAPDVTMSSHSMAPVSRMTRFLIQATRLWTLCWGLHGLNSSF
jgi:hypothetical protein